MDNHDLSWLYHVRDESCQRPILDHIAHQLGCKIHTAELPKKYGLYLRLQVVVTCRWTKKFEELPEIDTLLGRNVLRDWTLGQWLDVFADLNGGHTMTRDSLAANYQRWIMNMNRESARMD